MDYFLIIVFTPIVEFLSDAGWDYSLLAFGLFLLLILFFGILLRFSIKNLKQKIGLAIGTVTFSFALVYAHYWWCAKSLRRDAFEYGTPDTTHSIIQAGMVEISRVTTLLAIVCLAQLVCLIFLIGRKKQNH